MLRPLSMPWPARLAVVLGALAMVAIGIVLKLRGGPVATAAEVEAQIVQLALTPPGAGGAQGGGMIGSWWIVASALDERSGQLRNFRLSDGPLEVAATSARVVVDPIEDSFSFELFDVVLTRLPEETSPQPATLLTMEHYLLGPAPYGADIR